MLSVSDECDRIVLVLSVTEFIPDDSTDSADSRVSVLSVTQFVSVECQC